MLRWDACGPPGVHFPPPFSWNPRAPNFEPASESLRRAEVLLESLRQDAPKPDIPVDEKVDEKVELENQDLDIEIAATDPAEVPDSEDVPASDDNLLRISMKTIDEIKDLCLKLKDLHLKRYVFKMDEETRNFITRASAYYHCVLRAGNKRGTSGPRLHSYFEQVLEMIYVDANDDEFLTKQVEILSSRSDTFHGWICEEGKVIFDTLKKQGGMIHKDVDYYFVDSGIEDVLATMEAEGWSDDS